MATDDSRNVCPRCDRTTVCVLDRGHRGPCERPGGVRVVTTSDVEQGRSGVSMPDVMMDDEIMSPGDRIWLRADGMSRGKAQAGMACEVGCDFTDLRVRQEWLRQDSSYESEPGVAHTVVCKRTDPGATLYYMGTLKPCSGGSA